MKSSLVSLLFQKSIIIIRLFYIALFREHKDTLHVKKQKYKNNPHTQKREQLHIKSKLKKVSFVSVLRVLKSVQFLVCLGREFQREGAAAEKALSPQVRCLLMCGE